MTTSDKLLSLLDLFDLERPDWTVEDAATKLGLATSTAYRYFASLNDAGMLAPVGLGRYVLGPTIIRYDRQLRLTDPLISAARHELVRLAGLEPGRSVAFVCRLLGGKVMCVDQAAIGAPPFAVGYERGRLMPLYAGSASKIILAHLPSRQLRALHDREAPSFAAAGLGATWEAVRGTLREIRTAGHFVTSSEVDPGMRGISVPLADAGTALLASVNVAGPEADLTPPAIERLVEALKKAAVAIEAELASRSERGA